MEGRALGICRMKATNQSDEWLMGQVVLGRRDCLEVLVRRYATPLLTYL